MISEGTKTKKERYVSTPEERASSIAKWSSSQRALTDPEMKEWINNHYAFVRGISRTKYSARIVVVGSDGEFLDIDVSLPTVTISQ